jgi:DNA-directed RNA polymerase subunit RPC12/RpoP
MADRSLRGMRLGAQSLQSEEGVTFSPRVSHTYLCASCARETVMIFSADAEAPDEWECKYCSHVSTRLVDSKPVVVDHSAEKVARTHWDMLLERRSRAELEELLEERLAVLRERRGSQHKIGA